MFQNQLREANNITLLNPNHWRKRNRTTKKKDKKLNTFLVWKWNLYKIFKQVKCQQFLNLVWYISTLEYNFDFFEYFQCVNLTHKLYGIVIQLIFKLTVYKMGPTETQLTYVPHVSFLINRDNKRTDDRQPDSRKCRVFQIISKVRIL